MFYVQDNEPTKILHDKFSNHTENLPNTIDIMKTNYSMHKYVPMLSTALWNRNYFYGSGSDF